MKHILKKNIPKTYYNNNNHLNEKTVLIDPIKQFQVWFEEAVKNSGLPLPEAMTLSTSTSDGKPSARIILLKGFDHSGFIFYTNYESRKGKELIQNPYSSLTFYWTTLERQIRIDGITSKVTKHESDAYFNSRPKGSQIGALVSAQSSVIENRNVLDEKYNALEKEYTNKDVLRPAYWGGFCLKPTMMEFWQGSTNRLHDRILYTLLKDNNWKIERLAP